MPERKYLTLARRFSHRFIREPLLKRGDHLIGLHPNTQIPKVIGFLCIATLDEDTVWAEAAEFFYKMHDSRYVLYWPVVHPDH